MFIKRIITTLTTILLFLSILKADVDSSFYDIKITIKGFKYQKALLGYYYGDETYVVDSAKVDSLTGFMRFTRYNRLTEGMYFIANTEGVVLDFIVNGWKDFSIKTDINALIDSAEISRSEENKHYFNYLKSIRKIEKQLSELHKTGGTISDEDVKIYFRQQQSLENLNIFYIKKYPDLFFVKTLTSLQPNNVQQSISPILNDSKPYNRTISNTPQYLENTTNHYWDNFDFRDTRLLRSKVYVLKLNQYVMEIMPKDSDSIRHYCDILLAYSKVNLAYYQFTLKWLTKHFESKMPLNKADLAFVHLVENYHHRTESGTSKEVLQSLDSQVKIYKKGLNKKNDDEKEYRE